MDWLFHGEQGICHVRVAGVLLRDHKLLAQGVRGGNEYALIGGHLQFGETLEEALIREFREETGVDIRCQRLLWTEENFWTWNGVKAHNLAFYYLIDCDDTAFPDAPTPSKDNDQVVCEWLPLDRLADCNIYPAFLKQEIFHLPESPKHFVTRE